jgi:hypothetical protein
MADAQSAQHAAEYAKFDMLSLRDSRATLLHPVLSRFLPNAEELLVWTCLYSGQLQARALLQRRAERGVVMLAERQG